MLNLSDKQLTEEGNSGQLYSLRALKTPGMGRVLARVMLISTIVSFMVLFLPWQQNIRGTGKLTALNPGHRPQTIETTIPGRIAEWRISEGQLVQKGDTILTLSEIKEYYFDPQFLERLRKQIAAKETSLEAKQRKQKALETQIEALNAAQEFKQKQALNKLKQAHLKLESDSIGFETEKIQFENSRNIFERNKERFEAGNIPLTKFQELESKFEQSRAKVVGAENKWLQSQAELIIAQVDLSGVEADYLDKISKAQSDLSSTLADIADTEGSIVKMRNEYTNMEIRNQQYQIVAPQTGYVVKALKAGIGETIKEGEAVVTIMPLEDDKAAEMYIKAMDLPFISTNRKVRIEFDGWPSLQFSGWPNVSVGTFGGLVEVIDRVESNPGYFRILVKPDPDDEPWPEQLRMGSGIKGWVMLDDVPIWYELWRQLNGFPPSVYEEGMVKVEAPK